VAKFAFASLLIALGTNCASAQLADSAWPDYGGGYLNQHRSPLLGFSSQPRVLWQFNLDSIGVPQVTQGYHQPILLPDGTIVLNSGGSSNDQIMALNPNGTLRWFTDDSSLGPWLAASAAGHIYTIRHNYATVGTERLRSLDFAGNGEWFADLPNGLSSTQNSPAIGRDGTIYAAADTAELRAFTSTGAISWTSAASGYYQNPAIAVDGTIIDGGFALKSLAPDGTVQWSYPLRTAAGKFPFYLPAAIGDDGTIFGGQLNHPNLVALTPQGAVKWNRTDLDGAPSIGINGDVYVVPETGILHALNAETGTTRWTFASGKTDYYNVEGVTVDAAGNLYLANEQGIVNSLTPDGALRWSFDLAPAYDPILEPSAPIIGNNGVVYVVGGFSNMFFALTGVPEPTTSGLAFLAAGWLAGIRRRRGVSC
jgi:outer membrane protein assembly factor BamB